MSIVTLCLSLTHTHTHAHTAAGSHVFLILPKYICFVVLPDKKLPFLMKCQCHFYLPGLSSASNIGLNVETTIAFIYLFKWINLTSQRFFCIQLSDYTPPKFQSCSQQFISACEVTACDCTFFFSCLFRVVWSAQNHLNLWSRGRNFFLLRLCPLSRPDNDTSAEQIAGLPSVWNCKHGGEGLLGHSRKVLNLGFLEELHRCLRSSLGTSVLTEPPVITQEII